MVKHALLATLLLAACTDNSFVVQPVVDQPINDTASAFPIDSLTVSIAHAGSTVDIVSATFPRGATIQLSGVPFADDLVMHMTGRLGTSEVSYGRSCQFALRADGRIPVPHVFMSKTVKFGELSTHPLPREGGVALTYSDGSGVLVGGHVPGDPTQFLTQVERFDPNTGEYTTLHDVLRRQGASIALLGDSADTRIAVVGGVDVLTGQGAQYIELIDADRTSDRQYDMFNPEIPISRTGMSATTLTDGRVVVIGGKSPDDPTMPAVGEVDEVAIASGTPNAMKTRAVLAHPRYGHQATRLGDEVGSPVLVTGGLDATGQPVAGAELYKPLSQEFSTFTAQMIVPRYRHQAVRLPDGSVLIVGGIDATGQTVAKIELFTLDEGFLDVGDLPGSKGLVDLTATTLPDGRVLLTGGRQSVDGAASPNAYIASLNTFDGKVSLVATDRLGAVRAGHQATVMCDGTVLISGGAPDGTAYERYNPIATGRR